MFSNLKTLFRSPIDPTLPIVQTVKKLKTAREEHQAIFVGGLGLKREGASTRPPAIPAQESLGRTNRNT